MEKVICYYHKIDLDGKCSAAIVRRKYPDCELIGVDYPDRPDFEKINPKDMIIIVDFSFEPGDMVTLANLTCDKVVWIDHHKSAIEKIKTDYPFEFICKGARKIGKAACELTWEYLFQDEPMPEAVRLLGRYDVWDHADEDVLLFQYGARLQNCEPDAPIWRNAYLCGQGARVNGVDMTIQNGNIILKYENQRNATYAKAMAFMVKFEGHKAWAINKALSNSKIFETLPGLHAQARPLWILFRYQAGVWSYSLYAAPDSGIDVSEIAAKYGGGGHAGAAGFKSDKYLLKEQV